MASVLLTLLIGMPPGAADAATEFVVPGGPVITFQDGRSIEAHIISLDQTNVVILTEDGQSETLPRSTVQSVVFETVTGGELTGELVGWTPGIYQIATAEAAIKVYSTMPAVPPDNAPQTASNTADEPDLAADLAEDSTPSAEEDTSQGGSQAIAATTVDETANEAATTPVTAQTAAASPTSALNIDVSVENSKENGPPIAFNIQLSEPSDSSVVLIYATIDGTAVNGQDYEANRGVVVIKPGEQVARIEAPVLDDNEKEEQEHLQLFLTVDPTVAVVQNRQIIATIDDDDEG